MKFLCILNNTFDSANANKNNMSNIIGTVFLIVNIKSFYWNIFHNL